MDIALSSQVTIQPTGDGALLLDRKGEAYYELDEVGARLWQLLSVNGDLDAAVAQLLNEYEIEENELCPARSHAFERGLSVFASVSHPRLTPQRSHPSTLKRLRVCQRVATVP